MPAADRPVRLSVLIRRFHPVVGGMERQSLAVLGRLAGHGIAATVVTGRPRPELPTRESVGGLAVRRVGPAGGGRLGAYGGLPAFLRAPEARPGAFDVLAVFGTGDLALVGAAAARRAARPWLMRPATAGDLGRYLDPSLAPGGGPVRRWLRGHVPPSGWRAARLRSATAAVAISVEIAAELRRWGFGQEQVARIPNGVDTARFRPADDARKKALRARLGLPAEAPVALFLGRLVRRKGLLDLAEAWRGLAAAGRLPAGALLVVAGGGEGQADRVDAELRRELGGRSDVRLAGEVPSPQDWLAAADVVVLPSHAEGLPNAALEAMAAGVPGVLSDLPAHRELAAGADWALLHPAGDAEGLAGVMATLLADGDRRAELGRAARGLAVAGYGLEAAAERWASLVLRLAGRWGRPEAAG